MVGIKKHGKNWKLVEGHVPTRNGPQIRSHAQKFFKRIEYSAAENNFSRDIQRKSLPLAALDILQENEFSLEIIMSGLEKKDISNTGFSDQKNYENRLKELLEQPLPECDCENFQTK